MTGEAGASYEGAGVSIEAGDAAVEMMKVWVDKARRPEMVGGIGGCPFAPGATGNVATEDLVYMLERAGYVTGYDLDALIGTARWIGQQIGRPTPSALSRAGGWGA